MKRRSLLFAIAAGLLISGIGALDARAGQVALPSNLGELTGANSGNFVVTGLEPDTFSNFTFSASAIPGTTPVLTASGVNIEAYGPVGNESGISFSGAMFAPAGTTVDYKISFVVTAPAGSLLTDATLSAVYNTFAGNNGAVSIGETIIYPGGLKSLNVSSSDPNASSTVILPGVQSILVQKDILLYGGTTGIGVGVSIINQGFSSTAIPEPTSMALLGIGMTGFLAFRRLFKRTSVA